MNPKVCYPGFCIHIENMYLDIHVCRGLWEETQNCEYQDNFLINFLFRFPVEKAVGFGFGSLFPTRTQDRFEFP